MGIRTAPRAPTVTDFSHEVLLKGFCHELLVVCMPSMPLYHATKGASFAAAQIRDPAAMSMKHTHSANSTRTKVRPSKSPVGAISLAWAYFGGEEYIQHFRACRPATKKLPAGRRKSPTTRERFTIISSGRTPRTLVFMGPLACGSLG